MSCANRKKSNGYGTEPKPSSAASVSLVLLEGLGNCKARKTEKTGRYKVRELGE